MSIHPKPHYIMRQLFALFLVMLFAVTAAIASNPLTHFLDPACTIHEGIMNNSVKDLHTTVANLQDNEARAYVTHGQWSLPAVLDSFLQVCGQNSSVLIATWSITQAPLEKLANHIAEKRIASCTILTDHRSKIRAEQALTFAENICQVKYAKNHSKVILCRSADGLVSLVNVGSANFTRNPRCEAGVIFRSKEVWQFYQNAYNTV